MNKYNNLKNFLMKKWEIFIAFWIVSLALIIVYAYFLSSDENSRDAQRYADILSINDNLKLYYTKNNTYPVPNESVSITNSWEILTYQWYAWENLFAELWIDELKDPKTNNSFKYLNYYTFATDANKQKYQLMAFYEWNLDEKYKPTTQRKPFNYWDKVGIAIETNTSRAIQETKLWVDVVNTMESYTIYLDDKNILVWDKLYLKNFIANTEKSKSKSCLEIYQAGIKISGNYYINPLLDSNLRIPKISMKVYCDMENDGGWWTRLYYKNWKETCFNDNNVYNPFIIEKIFTKDFAVSDSLETIKSEWSWILKEVDFNDKDYNNKKMSNVANCTTPSWSKWTNDYNWGYLGIRWTLSTLWTWNKMFSWCEFYKNIWDKVIFNIWWMSEYNMTWDFIHTLCNNYSNKDNSITSRWDWNNTRVIWVR